MSETVSIHPSVDYGIRAADPGFASGMLACHCAEAPVEVRIEGRSPTMAAAGNP